ncbi:MAG: GAF domain-containing protein [Clostridia bacterium]|nr:GAF domain-containing protein [Clostridia bacterium]
MLCRQLDSLLEGTDNTVTNLANAAAFVYDALPGLNWAGFYTLNGEVLELGPFCGRPACTVIPMGRGVCGAAVQRGECITVPDVHLFEGHIACDSASQSEIVVPLYKNGRVWGVLDIDSPVKGRFSEADTEGIQRLAGVVEKHV